MIYPAGVGGIFLLVPTWALWSGIDLLLRPAATPAGLQAGARPG